MVGRAVRKFAVAWVGLGLLVACLSAQEGESRESTAGEVKKEKSRPPRIPDGQFVPKRGMIQREKGQFWAGPPEEGRFAQIVTLALVPKERLEEKLAAWPNYQNLNEAQRARLVERIDQFRETCRKQALGVAREFGLQVSPEQEEEFVRMYWTERVAMDGALRKELQKRQKKLEKESQERILQKFPRAAE